jgi:hypothetical protein
MTIDPINLAMTIDPINMTFGSRFGPMMNELERHLDKLAYKPDSADINNRMARAYTASHHIHVVRVISESHDNLSFHPLEQFDDYLAHGTVAPGIL